MSPATPYKKESEPGGLSKGEDDSDDNVDVPPTDEAREEFTERNGAKSASDAKHVPLMQTRPDVHSDAKSVQCVDNINHVAAYR